VPSALSFTAALSFNSREYSELSDFHELSGLLKGARVAAAVGIRRAIPKCEVFTQTQRTSSESENSSRSGE
jgi:hypothetical protein